MRFRLAYGKQWLDFALADEMIAAVLEPRHFSPERTPDEILRLALSSPIGSPPLKEIVKPGETVAIITSDITRPCPSHELLPPVLNELHSAGIDKKDIAIVFALGSHRRHSEEEKQKLVGDKIFGKYRCIDHDPSDCLSLGETSRHTPVEIFRAVVEADRRICLGNIEFHYFAGYSGGSKAIFPGVSTNSAIQANHRMMLEDGARSGNLESNPVRNDLDEIGNILTIDFILNVVLNQQKEIVHAVAGHYIEAHRAGCRFLDTIGKVAIQEQADIVIVSAGGYPKDINVYQAQKALDNAVWAVRPGGVVIWVASCSEGLGSKVFENWIHQSACLEDLIDRTGRDFQLGGHKAAAIAIALQKASIFLVSDLYDETARSFFVEPFPDIESAIRKALLLMGSSARVIVMPAGGSTLPIMTGK